jgi:carboxyl-terminal processing protease
MNAFTNVYDPHTSYFSPRTSENFNINMSLSLEGIGAVLQSDNEYTKVVRLVPGGPAQKQGQLSPADRIVGVAQGDKEMINVVGWRLDEVVELIRGDKHSLVRLEVIPTESQLDTETEVIPLIRDKVKLEEQAASSSKVIIERNGKSHTIGVIDLPTFYADFQAMQQGDPNYKSTTRDVLRLLNELQTEDAIEGLVIDLRGNGGGSLDEANRLTGLFINEGPTVQVRNANNRVEVLEDPDPELVYNGPLIVLVDRLSASASEIFAGAIQDYGRGIIMGSQTFGKGTVQSVRPLNHGQLKITQAKFYRISGASTQHKGVVPDIIVPALIDKTKVGEDSLEHALKWDSIQSAKFKNLNYITGVSETLTEKHMKRIVLQPEYNILLEEIALLETQRARDRVTLNKKERELENITFDKAQLTIINKRRALDKLASFKSIDDWTEFQKEQASKTEDDKEKDKADFVIKESAEVLLDFVELQEVLTAKAS